ncbi:MAG: CAP domain-containing protein [Lapillicoccus sp.]
MKATPRATAKATPTPTPTPTPSPKPTPPPPPQTGTAAYESQILALVNAERAAAGLRALSAQPCPDGFAEPWSPTMAAAGGLSHQALEPLLSRCGAHAAAENVGMTSARDPAAMVSLFMNSPGHRANILGASYTGIGIGAYRDSRGVWWVTQDFVG